MKVRSDIFVRKLRIVLRIGLITMSCLCFLSAFVFQLYSEETKYTLMDEFDTFDKTQWGMMGDPKGKWVTENGSLVMEGRDQRITSVKEFRYATLEGRMCILAQDMGTYYYVAFTDRQEKGGSIMLMWEGGMLLSLIVRKTGQEVKQIPISVTFFKGEWHTWKIVWTPSLVEVFIDGESCAKYNDETNIPDNFLYCIIDETHLKAGECKMLVDWVKVSGGEVVDIGTGGQKAGRRERNTQF